MNTAKTGLRNQGSVLIIALCVVSLLTGIAVAVMGPVGTSSRIVDDSYKRRVAEIAAYSAAERCKYIMLLQDAEVDDGISLAVQTAINTAAWTPVPLDVNEWVDAPQVTFPSIDALDSNGLPIFDTGITDLSFPQLPDVDNAPVRYIVYTTPGLNSSALSYVSAIFDGEVVNIRISYTRTPVLSETVIPNPLFNDVTQNKAAFGKDSVEMSGQGETDSWNSDLGPYTPASTTALGDIGSDGQIILKGQADVNGSVVMGPDGTLSQSGSGSYTGSAIQLDDPQDFPAINIPDIPLTQPTFTVGTNNVVNLGPGDYRYDTMQLNSKGVLNIQGPARIVIDSLFQMSGQSDLIIKGTDDVVFFCKETSHFQMSGQGDIITESLKPVNLRLYTEGTLHFTGQSDFYGLVYAPNAEFHHAGQVDIYGGIIAQDVRITGQGDIHWDEALLNANISDDFIDPPTQTGDEFTLTGPYIQTGFNYL